MTTLLIVFILNSAQSTRLSPIQLFQISSSVYHAIMSFVVQRHSLLFLLAAQIATSFVAPTPLSFSSARPTTVRLHAEAEETIVQVCGFKDCKRAGGGPRLQKLVNEVCITYCRYHTYIAVLIARHHSHNSCLRPCVFVLQVVEEKDMTNLITVEACDCQVTFLETVYIEKESVSVINVGSKLLTYLLTVVHFHSFLIFILIGRMRLWTQLGNQWQNQKSRQGKGCRPQGSWHRGSLVSICLLYGSSCVYPLYMGLEHTSVRHAYPYKQE